MKPENKEKVALNEQLQQAIDKVGNTPIEERELFKMFADPACKKSTVVKMALKRSDLDIKTFSAIEIARFYKALRDRVMSLRNEDGSFKETPATRECNLPNFEEAEHIAEAGHVYAMALEALLHAADNAEALKEAKANYEDAVQTLSDIIWPVSGIDRETLDKDKDVSAWEESLVVGQIIDSAKAVENTSLGKG